MGVFMVRLLVTLLNPDAMSTPPSAEVLESVAQLIERLAREQLNGANVDVQADAIQSFGQFLVNFFFLMQNISTITDSCAAEMEQLMVADRVRGTLQWTATNLGMTSTHRCPCGLVPIPRYAARVCGGSFGSGAMWTDSDTFACEFDELSFELCDAPVRIT